MPYVRLHRIWLTVVAMIFFMPTTAKCCVMLRFTASPAEELIVKADEIRFGFVRDENIVNTRHVSITVDISETIKGSDAKEIVVPALGGVLGTCYPPPRPKKGDRVILMAFGDLVIPEVFDPSSSYAIALRALRKKAVSKPGIEQGKQKSTTP